MVQQNLTQGPVRGHLLRMGAFMLATMLVQSAYGLIDLYWVGRLGKEAVAAVGIASNLMPVLMAVSQIVAVGAVGIVAQSAGRGDWDSVRRMFNQALMLSVLVAIAFAVVGFACIPVYSDQLAADAETAHLCKRFLGGFIPAMTVTFPTMALSTCLRGVGNVRIASIVQVGSVLVNVVLAPFLIFGWGTGKPMGVFGAALATLIANNIAFVVLLAYVIRNGQLFDRRSQAWWPQPGLWMRTMLIGLPSGVEFMLMAAYMMLVGWVLRSFGAAEQASFTIGMRLMQIGMMVGMALAFSASAIVGQNYGAKLPQRVRETLAELLKINVLAMMVFALAFHIAPRILIGIFSQDPAVLDAGQEILIYLSWNLLASSVVMTGFGMFTGFGNTVPSLIASALRVAVIATALLLVMHRPTFAPRWIWILSICGSLIQGGTLLWLLRREMRRRLGPIEEMQLMAGTPVAVLP